MNEYLFCSTISLSKCPQTEVFSTELSPMTLRNFNEGFRYYKILFFFSYDLFS